MPQLSGFVSFRFVSFRSFMLPSSRSSYLKLTPTFLCLSERTRLATADHILSRWPSILPRLCRCIPWIPTVLHRHRNAFPLSRAGGSS